MGQQPDLEKIDLEARRVVYLLNEIPYIQTFSSCSGHPDNPKRDWLLCGWVALQPVDDNIRAFWEFLDSLRVKLNETNPQMLEFSREIDAQNLYTSKTPLARTEMKLDFRPAGKTNTLVFWNSFIDSVQEFLEQTERVSIETRADAANLLIKWFDATEHIQETLYNPEGESIRCHVVWNYESCQWCWDLLKHMNTTLSKVLKPSDAGHPQFHAHRHFVLGLIVESPDMKRTREEHSKMWSLLEAAVIQLAPQLEQVVLPAECPPGRSTKQEKKQE